MALDQVEKARAFHRSFPQYTVTPLTQLDKLAKRLGLGGVEADSHGSDTPFFVRHQVMTADELIYNIRGRQFLYDN